MHNKHYIRLDGDKIIHGFSDAFGQPQDCDICINEQGGRHFELLGQTNPLLRDENAVLLYKWDGKEAQRRTQAEIDADMAEPTHAQQRETAYKSQPIVNWNGELITVDQANEIWLHYAAEGSAVADEIEPLIHTAKEHIRAQYPDS